MTRKYRRHVGKILAPLTLQKTLFSRPIEESSESMNWKKQLMPLSDLFPNFCDVDDIT
jgi:hypothetical protein